MDRWINIFDATELLTELASLSKDSKWTREEASRPRHNQWEGVIQEPSQGAESPADL